MRTKRILSIALALVMLLGMLPGMSLTASAAGNTTEITPTNTSGTMTITLTISAPHTHNFEYSASGDTITATCQNDGCDLTDNKVTLKIVPTTNLYANDGTSKEASLEGLEAYNAATGMNLSTSNIAYYKSGQTVGISRIKNGNLGTGTYEARIAYNGTDNFGSKVAKVSFTVTLKPTPHTHSFSYAASGNVITATCNGAGTCDLANNQATLTLNAPLHTAYGDGKDANATFTGEIPGVNNPTIHYSKGDVTLNAAPTDVGTYKAWCQLGNATARVEYTIDKAINPGWATLPQAKANLVYTGEPLELITAGTASAGSALYTVGTDPDNEPDDSGRPYTSSVPEMTNAGTYYVWYKIDGGKNYTSVAAQKVEVTIASINFHSADEVAGMIANKTAPENNDPETKETDKLFLGWYADEACTQPITNPSEIPAGGAYAKFIPTNSLGLAVQFRKPAKSGQTDRTDLRLIATVPDSALYSAVGFKVEALRNNEWRTLTDSTFTENIYSDYVVQTMNGSTSRFTLADALAAHVGNAEWSTRITCCALLNMPNSYYTNGAQTQFRVTQYIITKDGTRSEIGAKSFTIAEGEGGYPCVVA